MSAKFWTMRFLAVLVAAFVAIGAAQLLKGHGVSHAAAHGAFWGLLTAAVYTAAAFFRARRCALCKDAPKMVDQTRP